MIIFVVWWDSTYGVLAHNANKDGNTEHPSRVFASFGRQSPAESILNASYLNESIFISSFCN